MIYEASPFAIGLFIAFVLSVLWISSYFAKKRSLQRDIMLPAEQSTGESMA